MTTVDLFEFGWILDYELREENPDYPKIDIPMDDLVLARFDPWTCSEHEARAAMRWWLAIGNDRTATNNPWFQYKIAEEVSSCREIIENTKLPNHGLNLMNCTNKVLHHQLIAPQWLAQAFDKVCQPVLGRTTPIDAGAAPGAVRPPG